MALIVFLCFTWGFNQVAVKLALPEAAPLLQCTIRTALADQLLFGRLSTGGKVTVDLDSNEKVQLIFAEEETASVA